MSVELTQEQIAQVARIVTGQEWFPQRNGEVARLGDFGGHKLQSDEWRPSFKLDDHYKAQAMDLTIAAFKLIAETDDKRFNKRDLRKKAADCLVYGDTTALMAMVLELQK